MRFIRRIFLGDKINRSSLFWWGLPVIATLVVFFMVTWPAWQSYRLKRDLYQEKLELLVKYQAKLSQSKSDFKKELSKGQKLEKKIFIGLDPYIIVSELEKEIDAIPELSLRSFRIIKRENLTDQIQKVKLLLILDGDIKGLLNFLDKLSKSNKALHISRLTIISRRYRSDYILSVNLEIEALYSVKRL
ncbi:hypothetical protein [Thermodesulfatator indicus]